MEYLHRCLWAEQSSVLSLIQHNFYDCTAESFSLSLSVWQCTVCSFCNCCLQLRIFPAFPLFQAISQALKLRNLHMALKHIENNCDCAGKDISPKCKTWQHRPTAPPPFPAVPLQRPLCLLACLRNQKSIA